MNVTASTLIGCVLILGATVGVYASIQSEQATQNTNISTLQSEVIQLNTYDTHLQENVDMNRETNVRLETLYLNTDRNVSRLTDTIDRLDGNIRKLSIAIAKREKS